MRKPVGALLDVAQQGQRGPLDQDARLRLLGQRVADGAQQDPELAVDDLRVQALLGAEMLVDHRFGHACGGGDLLDRGPVQPAEGEEPAADADELAAALGPRHPDPRHVAGGPYRPAAAALRPSGRPCAVAHSSIMPHIIRPGAGPGPGAAPECVAKSWLNCVACRGGASTVRPGVMAAPRPLEPWSIGSNPMGGTAVRRAPEYGTRRARPGVSPVGWVRCRDRSLARPSRADPATEVHQLGPAAGHPIHQAAACAKPLSKESPYVSPEKTGPAAVIVLAAGAGTRMKSANPQNPPRDRRALPGRPRPARRPQPPPRASSSPWSAMNATGSPSTSLGIDPASPIADQDEVPGTGRAVELGLEALPRGDGAGPSS